MPLLGSGSIGTSEGGARGAGGRAPVCFLRTNKGALIITAIICITVIITIKMTMIIITY